MRLLNATDQSFVEFFSDVPAYTVLSHTWGAEEVTYQEFKDGDCEAKLGYRKIKFACMQTLKDGYEWTWVDTCCIDKTSSAELTEAINSMYSWYYEAASCYVYLVDATWKGPIVKNNSATQILDTIKNCLWFTRGWTLQELLASSELKIFDKDWIAIFEDKSKNGISLVLSTITGINRRCIENRQAIRHEPIATRMSWASGRRCTRVEDTAYCLMGLFDVNMPLLYGEGDKAFMRLQEQIWNSTDDHTLLCWFVDEHSPRAWTLESAFAQSPKDFRFSSDIMLFGNEVDDPGQLTKWGIPLRTSLSKVDEVDFGSFMVLSRPAEEKIMLATLNCGYKDTDHRSWRSFIVLVPAQMRWDPFCGGNTRPHSSFARMAIPRRNEIHLPKRREVLWEETNRIFIRTRMMDNQTIVPRRGNIRIGQDIKTVDWYNATGPINNAFDKCGIKILGVSLQNLIEEERGTWNLSSRPSEIVLLGRHSKFGYEHGFVQCEVQHASTCDACGGVRPTTEPFTLFYKQHLHETHVVTSKGKEDPWGILNDFLRRGEDIPFGKQDLGTELRTCGDYLAEVYWSPTLQLESFDLTLSVSASTAYVARYQSCDLEITLRGSCRQRLRSSEEKRQNKVSIHDFKL
ncbi:hypothetical protein S7711_01542 [Stachybotrys chartarum IBT 7711]|uniref:Heterokaryon incompatibility domain-containing protein n=1 Tax=Stachybotrys chartarum (strain CBS 109288 / IBT 7711) TaxID=1280523 RepID=A0A084BBZ9_STACB|nr:hypothetical protein S7711_01542 [Stachybotrys chartarum IBT 7711]